MTLENFAATPVVMRMGWTLLHSLWEGAAVCVIVLAAMRMLFQDAGLVIEPAGAAGLAAIASRRAELAGARVATPLCGGNLTEEQVRRWLLA